MEQRYMNGLDLLQQKWKKNRLKEDQPAHLNLTVIKIEKNLVISEICADELYLNTLGEVKGSFATNVLEFMTECVAQTALKADFRHQNADLMVKFCQKIPVNTILLCQAKIVNVGRSIIIAEAVIEDYDGEIYAYATSTHKIIKVEHQKIA